MSQSSDPTQRAPPSAGSGRAGGSLRTPVGQSSSLCGLKLIPAKWRCLVPGERWDGAQSRPARSSLSRSPAGTLKGASQTQAVSPRTITRSSFLNGCTSSEVAESNEYTNANQSKNEIGIHRRDIYLCRSNNSSGQLPWYGGSQLAVCKAIYKLACGL